MSVQQGDNKGSSKSGVDQYGKKESNAHQGIPNMQQSQMQHHMVTMQGNDLS